MKAGSEPASAAPAMFVNGPFINARRRALTDHPGDRRELPARAATRFEVIWTVGTDLAGRPRAALFVVLERGKGYSSRCPRLPADEFRSAMHPWRPDADTGRGGRASRCPPQAGEWRRALPPHRHGAESLAPVLDDYRRVIEPNVTHWNHPGFFAYFAITGSGPGILGETLAAALNINAMLWRTSPAATELEETVCDWLAQMMELPADFRGHINDTASTSSLVALAAARHRLPGLDARIKGLSGRPDAPPLTVYASDQAHSSIDKSAIVLGVGQENVRRIESDGEFRMSVPALAQAIAADRAAGRLPMGGRGHRRHHLDDHIDPVPAIADSAPVRDLAALRRASAGSARDRPRAPGGDAWPRAGRLAGGQPQSGCSPGPTARLLYVRDPAHVRAAFSLVPEYLRTSEEEVTNLSGLRPSSSAGASAPSISGW